MGAITQKVLANNTKMCYTYDSLNRVTEKVVKSSDGSVISTETFDYDAAGTAIAPGVGTAIGFVAGFVTGYHYDFSISLSGIINDLLEYFQ